MKLIHGPSADIWSLGCIIFRLLTGEHLFLIRCNSAELRNEEHLTAIFEICRSISKIHIQSSSLRKKLFKIFKKVKDFPSVYMRKTIKSILVKKYNFEPHKIADLIFSMNECLEFVPVERKTAKEMLNENSKKYINYINEKLSKTLQKEKIDMNKNSILNALKYFNEAIQPFSVGQVKKELNNGVNQGNNKKLSFVTKEQNLKGANFNSDSLSEKSEKKVKQSKTKNHFLSFGEPVESSFDQITLSDISHADFEDFDLNIQENPNKLFSYLQGRRFESGIQNFEELRKTCDRSFVHNSLYIGHDIGINVDCIDVKDESCSE